MLIAAGRNPIQVSWWLGHRKSSVTLDVYAHHAREPRRQWDLLELIA